MDWGFTVKHLGGVNSDHGDRSIGLGFHMESVLVSRLVVDFSKTDLVSIVVNEVEVNGEIAIFVNLNGVRHVLNVLLELVEVD